MCYIIVIYVMKMLQMTGLDIEKDQIMEIACVITDSDLNVVATQPEIIINQPLGVLEQMNSWCTKQHGFVSKYKI